MSEERAEGKRSNLIVAVPVILFLAVAIVFAFSLGSGDPSKLPSALIGKPVPQFDFEPLEGLVRDGRPVPGLAAADLAKGEVTVVNFWASWCVPCVQEHPLLVALAGQGVRVVGINYKDPAPGGRRFLGRYGNPYVAVGTDPNGRGAIEWGVYGMPETFVVAKDGRIAYKHVGPLTAAVVTDKILPAVAEAGR